MSEIQSETIQHIITKAKEILTGRDRPILIAIDGRSGTGKSNFDFIAAGILAVLQIAGWLLILFYFLTRKHR